jgi:DNA mismatch endonuclease (patch repair protein)
MRLFEPQSHQHNSILKTGQHRTAPPRCPSKEWRSTGATRARPLCWCRSGITLSSMALTRSEQMARIRGQNTTPELTLRRLLWRAGLRYRVHATTPAGRPDVMFPAARVAVFIDGCFWHGCPDHYVRPRSSEEFWSRKLVENCRRDCDQTKRLEALGWRVCRVWEHEVFETPANVVQRIKAAITGGSNWQPQTAWRVVKVVEIDRQLDRERRYLQDLRDSRRRTTITQRRNTRKWRRMDWQPDLCQRQPGVRTRIPT